MQNFSAIERGAVTNNTGSNIKALFPLPAADSRQAPLVHRTRINLSRLINTLNYKNFQGETILVNFKDSNNGHCVSIPAHPEPCTDNHLECVWKDGQSIDQLLATYNFLSLSITDGLNQILVQPDLQDIGLKGLSLTLPDQSYNVTQRSIKRHPCRGIEVQFIQNGICLTGTLVDFNSSAIKVSFVKDKLQSFPCNNINTTCYAIVKNDIEVYFFDECEIIRKTTHNKTISVIMKSTGRHTQKINPCKNRSLRQKFVPSPDVTFNHPFTGKKIHRNIIDLSGTGLSVEENADDAVFLPGMIIPEINIEFMNSFSIKCKAQVLYCNQLDDSTMKCGLVFMDMNSQDHITLSNLLYRVEDKNSYIGSTSVNPDALWNFFFETGFVYPKKYDFMARERASYRRLYEKLYGENTHISRHIIYQENGKVYGHAAMLRTYEKTWMIHHHAAISQKKKAGLVVMDQLGRHTGDYHTLESSMMDYIICYFRPENRFPNRVFGDVAKNVGNQKQCSIDTFAYFHTERKVLVDNLVSPWSLELATFTELAELKDYYEQKSGGLFVQALDLDPEENGKDLDISSAYTNAGFKRERYVYALKNEDTLRAMFIVNLSDVGMNMSELTSCIHAIILHPEKTCKQDIQIALDTITRHYEEQEHIPVLMYPSSFAEEHELPVEKKYNLWILDLEYDHLYLEHIDKLLSRNRGEELARRSTDKRQDVHTVNYV